MADPRTLRDITRVASLGVSVKDQRLIKDLIKISRKLKDSFEYIDVPDFEKIDILFVNSDDESTMDFYKNHCSNMRCIPIFLYNRKAGVDTPLSFLAEYPNAKSLNTPITLTKFGRVLLEVISANKANTRPGSIVRRKEDCFKILVVDDSFPVRKYMEEKLPVLMADIDQNLHFDIEFAASGREAVDKVKKARGAYDIVFLDIMMDDIDGYQICKWIKKVKRSINVVLLTSKSSPIDKMRGNLSGCDNYLSKPPKDSHLKKVILKHRKFEKKPIPSQS